MTFKISHEPYIIKENPSLYFIYKPAKYLADKQIINIDNPNNILNFISKLKIDNGLKNATYKYGQLNRLDYGTAGTILVAKNIQEYDTISNDIHNHNMIKIYVALVEGKIDKPTNFIFTYIEKKRKKNKNIMTYNNKHGEPTLSEYYVYKEYEINNKIYSLILIRIYSGMTHQIRIHMKSIGHPLINDDIYGNFNKDVNNGDIFLISYIYCLNKTECSINYTNELSYGNIFTNAKLINDYKYLTSINYLINNNKQRTDMMDLFMTLVQKHRKEINYYQDKQLINIPAGKLNDVPKDVLTKLNCILDNRIHSVGIIDLKASNYVYYMCIRNEIGLINTNNYIIIPIYHIKYKDLKYTQILIKFKINISSYDELINTLAKNDIIALYTGNKIKTEHDIFIHYHNYTLPVINNKIVNAFWLDNIYNNKNKYNINLDITKTNYYTQYNKNMYDLILNYIKNDVCFILQFIHI